MSFKTFFLGVFLAFSIVTGAHASDALVTDVFSGGPHTTAGVQVPSAAPNPSETEPHESTLGFFDQGPLESAEENEASQRIKTVIHFLTGIDVDQLASPLSLKKQVEGVEIPVSVLVYEKCTNTGGDANTSSECEWRYSSGFTSKLMRHQTEEDGTIVSRMVIIETNREKNWQGRREVIHTTKLAEGLVTAETYDITYDLGLTPSDTAVQESAKTREVLRYNYDSSTEEKKIKDMSWTKYADTRGEIPREMEYHAVLTYDDNGRPERGIATKWTTGWKDKVLFDWHSQKDIPDLTAREMWQMWEQWIKNGPTHVFIA